jgi:hypothetical protein
LAGVADETKERFSWYHEHMPSHHEIDATSLELHRAVARKVRQHPELLAHAKNNLARWRKDVERGDASSRPYLEAWERLMSRGVEAVLAAATQESEDATALRHVSPFAGVLTQEERLAIIQQRRAKRAS